MITCYSRLSIHNTVFTIFEGNPSIKCSCCLLMNHAFSESVILSPFSLSSQCKLPFPSTDPRLPASAKLYKDALIDVLGTHWKVTPTWLSLDSTATYSKYRYFLQATSIHRANLTEQYMLCQAWLHPPLGFTTCFCLIQ